MSEFSRELLALTMSSGALNPIPEPVCGNPGIRISFDAVCGLFWDRDDDSGLVGIA
jgi:hypothetical protein